MNITPELNRLKIIFDNNVEAAATPIIKDEELFNGEIRLQLVEVVWNNPEAFRFYDLEAIAETVIMSVNETNELDWYSDIWGYRYKLFTSKETM